MRGDSIVCAQCSLCACPGSSPTCRGHTRAVVPGESQQLHLSRAEVLVVPFAAGAASGAAGSFGGDGMALGAAQLTAPVLRRGAGKERGVVLDTSSNLVFHPGENTR